MDTREQTLEIVKREYLESLIFFLFSVFRSAKMCLDRSRPIERNVDSFIRAIRKTYLELGEAFTVKFLCSIAVLVMEEFHCTCTCVFGILNEFLK